MISGDPNKIITGTAHDTEYTNIQTAIATKSDAASPTFTGTVTAAAITVSGAATLSGVTTVVDGNLSITGSADATKKLQFEVDGFTTGTTRVLTPQNVTGTIALISEFAYLGLPSSSGRLLLPNDYISGFALTNNGATGMDVALGQAMDSTNTVNIIGSAIANKTQAAWVAGTAAGGKLHAAAMANNAWYYWFAIYKTADGTVDYGFDVSTTPTLPAGYSKYRYIGARKSQFAATNWDTYVQHGDEVWWSTPPALDFNGAMTAANRVLTTMNTPAIKVKWYGQAQLNNTASTGTFFYLTDPSVADVSPAVSSTPLGSGGSSVGAVGGNVQTASQVTCWTNGSSQIGVRGTGLQTLILQTIGWMDPRGKPV